MRSCFAKWQNSFPKHRFLLRFEEQADRVAKTGRLSEGHRGRKRCSSFGGQGNVSTADGGC